MIHRALLLMVVLPFALLAVPGPPKDTDAILGVWQAKMDDLPFVTLTITDEGGELAGAILFYLLRRDEGKPPSSSPGIPEPLLKPKFDGKSLTFQVSHRRAHPGTQYDPPVNFRLTLTGPDEGTLIREGDEPGIKDDQGEIAVGRVPLTNECDTPSSLVFSFEKSLAHSPVFIVRCRG